MEGTRAGSRSYPKKIICWENFEVEAADDNRNDNYVVDKNPIAYNWTEEESVHSEEHVRQQFLIDIANPMSCCRLGKIKVGDFGTTIIASENKKGRKRGYRCPVVKADVTCSDKKGVYALGEVKTEWSLDALDPMPRSGAEEICELPTERPHLVSGYCSAVWVSDKTDRI